MRKKLLFILVAFFSFCNDALAAVNPKLPALPVGLGTGKEYRVSEFGAKGDGVTDDTRAIQRAIDACGKGGVVLLGKGTYLAHTIVLHSDMTLKLGEGAVLKGTARQADYQPQRIDSKNTNWGPYDGDHARAFIFAYRANNISITGPGTIDGTGRAKVWEGKDELGRPIPIYLVQCRRVLLDGFTVKDGAMWNIVPFESDDVTVRNVSVDANIVPNRDGIDIVDCHRVLVENCSFYTDDDCICPKSGHERGVKDVTVRNCTIKKCGRANGLKFGTKSYGGFQRMLFENITLNDVHHAGIAVESVDGGKIKDIEFRNITMNKVGTPLFVILGLRSDKSWGVKSKPGSISNITFDNIKANDCQQDFGCIVSGVPQAKLQNLTFRNLDITFRGGVEAVPDMPGEYNGRYPECDMWMQTPAAGFLFRHARGVVMENCKLQVAPGDVRSLVVNDDAQVKRSAFNPVFGGWYADPEAIVYGDKFWIYPTTSTARPNQTYFDCFSSPDLVNWTRHPRIISTDEVKWAKKGMWAPAAISANGKYYFFFGANDVHEGEIGGIGVAIADKPEGPYRDALGKPLIGNIVNGAQPIDQMVFRDDDGSYYMYYGGWGHCNVVRMSDDLLSLVPFEDGTTYKEITPSKDYVEGPYMFKRKGKYYFMWSEGGWGFSNYCVAYATSDSPTGPFVNKGKILQQDLDVATGTGHNSVVRGHGDDEWYIVYHRRPLGETKDSHRVVCIDKLLFDNDGNIIPVKPTFEGVNPTKTKLGKKH